MYGDGGWASDGGWVEVGVNELAFVGGQGGVVGVGVGDGLGGVDLEVGRQVEVLIKGGVLGVP